MIEKTPSKIHFANGEIVRQTTHFVVVMGPQKKHNHRQGDPGLYIVPKTIEAHYVLQSASHPDAHNMSSHFRFGELNIPGKNNNKNFLFLEVPFTQENVSLILNGAVQIPDIPPGVVLKNSHPGTLPSINRMDKCIAQGLSVGQIPEEIKYSFSDSET